MATNIEDINNWWAEDCKIDETALGSEAAKNPLIHSKYSRVLSTTKLHIRKAESDYLTTRRIKLRYFKGELGKEELQQLGWSQYQGRALTKTEMEEYLDTDSDLIKLLDKKEYHVIMKELLESILKQITSRTWDVKSAIEYAKMQNGLI